MQREAFEQLIANLERAGAPYSLPEDWILCRDDDVLRDGPSAERLKWLRKAKAEVLRRNIQERIDEIAQATEDGEEDFAELLLSAFCDDIKPFGLAERQRQSWIQRAELAKQP